VALAFDHDQGDLGVELHDELGLVDWADGEGDVEVLSHTTTSEGAVGVLVNSVFSGTENVYLLEVEIDCE
jgi:hypothetical protein